MSTLHRELCGIVSALQTYEHYIIGSPFPIYLCCYFKPILFYGDAMTTISSLFPISGDHYEIPELEDHLDARHEISLSGYSQQKDHDRRIPDAPPDAPPDATQTHSA